MKNESRGPVERIAIEFDHFTNSPRDIMHDAAEKAKSYFDQDVVNEDVIVDVGHGEALSYDVSGRPLTWKFSVTAWLIRTVG